MSSEVKSYVTYVRTSFSDIVKALAIVLLISMGPFIAVAMRVGGIDGWTILYVGCIEEVITFVILFILGRKGLILKNLRQEDFQKSTKKEKKAPAESKEE